jgi:hypothetical protein
MKCLSKIEDQNSNIKYGDILIYSNCQAYLILRNFSSEKEALSLQIFNNGNEELGEADYSAEDIETLLDKLYNNYGIPKRIVNIKDVSISLE